HGSPRQLVDEVLAMAGLEGHEHKRFNQLSAGLKQRAAIAHALVSEPELIIADEPTSNLDPVERARLLEILRNLADRGVTVIVSSHVVHEVIRVSDRLVVMNRGRVVASGAPHEILSGYCKARVRASDPGRLASALNGLGFRASTVGLNVVVDLDGMGWRRLLSLLAEVEGVEIYQVDFIDVALEEVLKGEEARVSCNS
ncbi:MAG TPA: ABC transporter ATP-binding protein, partial [Pyrodictium sp.]|nr:ABC transporter ATP-binding protein [Pyrodictium sp.]